MRWSVLVSGGPEQVSLPVIAFAAFWLVFTATIGATSSYWGQLYTPLAVIGTAALVAGLAAGVDRSR